MNRLGRVAAITLLAWVPCGIAHAQRLPQPPPGRQNAPPRRDALERQVLMRFLNRASDEMSLDAAKRSQLSDVVHGIAMRRKSLNQRSVELHRKLIVAVKTPETPAATFTRLIEDQQAMRKEEHQIADDEMTELGRVLTPRQQAQYTLLWLRLQENARQIQAIRPAGGPQP